MPANLKNSAVATGLEKVSFHSNPKEISNAKECSNLRTIALISHASKVMLKIMQAKLQQYVIHEFLDVQAGFRKGRGTRNQIANIHWIIKKKKKKHKKQKTREFQKNVYICFIDYAKAIDCVDCNKLENSSLIFKVEYQTTWTASWEICMQVKKQQLEMDMEQQTSSK